MAAWCFLAPLRAGGLKKSFFAVVDASEKLPKFNLT